MNAKGRKANVAAEKVAYAAGEMSTALLLGRLRAERLEERLKGAAEAGLSRAECEAMTQDLDGVDVKSMLDRAYAPKEEQ